MTEPWLPLASDALNAVLGEHDAASAALQRLHDDFDPKAMTQAMIAWIDTLLTALPPKPPDADVHLRFIDPGGSLLDTDRISPRGRWAGRLIAARAAMDQDQFIALLKSTADDRDPALNVSALLLAVAASLRTCGWHL